MPPTVNYISLNPALRKLALTSHIVFSVGWLGAVAGFLALAIAGLSSHDTMLVRSAYIAMELLGWYAIVPASLAALLTGLVQALGTPWGLFRHYWILAKLVLTVAATLLLFLHMKPIGYLAEVASRAALSGTELQGLRIQMVADAGAALLVLLAATAISVYKPWGRTPFGSQNQHFPQNGKAAELTLSKQPLRLYLILGLIGLVILLFIALHLKGDFGHH